MEDRTGYSAEVEFDKSATIPREEIYSQAKWFVQYFSDRIVTYDLDWNIVSVHWIPADEVHWIEEAPRE